MGNCKSKVDIEEQKIIVVIGATGQQGGSVIKHLQNIKMNIKIRALTRNPEKLANTKFTLPKNSEIVIADLNDIQSLKSAFEGAYGVFAVTNFWELFSGEKEKSQAYNIAKACQYCKIEHVVWSTLESTEDFLKNKCEAIEGTYTVPHFDAKAEANQFFIDLKVPTTFLNTSFYYQNYMHFGMGPKKINGQQMINFNMGKSKLSMVDVDDIGKAVLNIFSNYKQYVNTTQYIASEQLTGSEIAQIFSEVYNINCIYNEMSDQSYRELGFQGVNELANMFIFYRENTDFNQNRNIQSSKKLIGSKNTLQNFKQWLIQNKNEISIEL